jgi:hypothetical protein
MLSVRAAGKLNKVREQIVVFSNAKTVCIRLIESYKEGVQLQQHTNATEAHTPRLAARVMIPNICRDIGSGFCLAVSVSKPDNVRGNNISCGRKRITSSEPLFVLL